MFLILSSKDGGSELQYDFYQTNFNIHVGPYGKMKKKETNTQKPYIDMFQLYMNNHCIWSFTTF